MSIGQEKKLLLITIILSLLPTIIWHVVDETYPMGDAGDYFLTTQAIYDNFFRHGFFEGLKNTYWIRAWKPIIFPHLCVPFLFLTGGKVILAVSLYMLSVQTALTYYLFKTYRMWLTPLWAALATLFITASPSVFSQSFEFMTELTLCLFLIMTYYYLSRFDFQKISEAVKVGCVVALALLVRPVEAAIYLSPFLLITFFNLYQKRSVTRLFIALHTLLILVMAFVQSHMFFMAGIHFKTGSTTILFLLPIILLGCYWYRGVERNVSIVFSIIYLSVMGFFWDHLAANFKWIETTTFGQMAVETGNRQGRSLLGNLGMIFNYHGKFLTGFLLLSTAGFLVYSRFEFIRKNFKNVISILIAFSAPILLGLFTHNGDNRYYVPGFMFLYLLCGFILFTQENWARKFSAALVVLLIFSFHSLNLPKIFNFEKIPHSIARVHFRHANSHTNDHLLLGELKKWRGFNLPGSMIVNLPILSERSPNDPWRIQLYLREQIQNPNTIILTPNVGLEDGVVWPLSNTQKQIKASPTLILMGPVWDDLRAVNQIFNMGNALSDLLLKAYRSNTLHQYHFKLLKEFTIYQSIPNYPAMKQKYLLIEGDETINFFDQKKASP